MWVQLGPLICIGFANSIEPMIGEVSAVKTVERGKNHWTLSGIFFGFAGVISVFFVRHTTFCQYIWQLYSFIGMCKRSYLEYFNKFVGNCAVFSQLRMLLESKVRSKQSIRLLTSDCVSRHIEMSGPCRAASKMLQAHLGDLGELFQNARRWSDLRCMKKGVNFYKHTYVFCFKVQRFKTCVDCRWMCLCIRIHLCLRTCVEIWWLSWWSMVRRCL